MDWQASRAMGGGGQGMKAATDVVGRIAPTSDVLYDFIGKALCGIPLF